MSSVTSSRSSLPATPPSEEHGATSRSSSLYLPSALAQTASSFLRRFYTEPAADHSLSSSTARSGSSSSLDVHQSQSQVQAFTSSFGWAPSTSTIPSVDGTYTPPPRRRPSPFQPPPLHPLTLRGLKRSSGNPSAQLLTRTLAEEIRLLVPPRLQLMDEWTLAYSLDRDGVSLATLYNKCEAWRTSSRRGGFVVVVKDGGGGVYILVSLLPFSLSFFNPDHFADIPDAEQAILANGWIIEVIRRISLRPTPPVTALLWHRRMFPLAIYSAVTYSLIILPSAASQCGYYEHDSVDDDC